MTMVDVKYRLHPGVFYRSYGDFVAVFHTGIRKVFTFNSISADIFDCFTSYCSVPDALSRLRHRYAVDDAIEFETTVRAFVEDVAEKGILRPEYSQLENRNNLEARIADCFTDGNQLYSATMELTYRCNERCRHCFIVNEHRKELTTDQFTSVLDQMADMGVLNVVFTGGEVFVRKDAFDILEHAYSRGFAIDIFTNGTLLDGDDYIRLKSLWPRCVHFSVYSHVPEKHDAVTMVPGSLEKTLASIKACALIGIPVNIKTIVFQETVDDVAGLVRLANSIGASIEVGRGIVPKKNGDLSVTALKVTDAGDYHRVSTVLNGLIGEADCVDLGKRAQDKICGAGEHSISISPYGEVYPCNTMPLLVGDVTESPLREIWEESGALKWWRENNVIGNKLGCDGCPLASRCVFCPGEAMTRTKDPLRMYPDACAATRLADEGSAVS
jgi:radical SAM protein with 4Fe4S-binding SPASM domain